MERMTMTLNLTPREMEVVEELAAKHDLSKTAVVRQALRLYQLVDHELARGGRLHFGDERRLMFVGVGWPDPAGRAALEATDE